MIVTATPWISTTRADLKREYQQFLQEHNRDRPDRDGRPDHDAREIETWARDHGLPYFDDHVHFPDFRIEYELFATACPKTGSMPLRASGLLSARHAFS